MLDMPERELNEEIKKNIVSAENVIIKKFERLTGEPRTEENKLAALDFFQLILFSILDEKSTEVDKDRIRAYFDAVSAIITERIETNPSLKYEFP